MPTIATRLKRLEAAELALRQEISDLRVGLEKLQIAELNPRTVAAIEKIGTQLASYAEAVSQPAYSVQLRQPDGKHVPLTIVAVHSFRGNVLLTVKETS